MKIGIKHLWVMLAVSVMVNLFCLGWFAARSSLPFRARMQQHERERERENGGGPRGFLRRSGLRDAGPEVQAILKRQRSELHDHSQALGEARHQAQDALRAEPFEPARLQRSFGDVRAQTASMQAAMHQALEEVAGKLNTEQRKRLAEALWHRRGDQPDPPAF
jgi:uncharacterized membrane protein